jgi:hypothetical protein
VGMLSKHFELPIAVLDELVALWQAAEDQNSHGGDNRNDESLNVEPHPLNSPAKFSLIAVHLSSFGMIPVQINQDSRPCTELCCHLIQVSVDRIVVALQGAARGLSGSRTAASVAFAASVRQTLGVVLSALAEIGARASSADRHAIGDRVYAEAMRVLDAGNDKMQGPTDLVYRSRVTWVMLRAQCLLKLGQKQAASELLDSVRYGRDEPFATPHMLLLQLSLSR